MNCMKERAFLRLPSGNYVDIDEVVGRDLHGDATYVVLASGTTVRAHSEDQREDVIHLLADKATEIARRRA